MRDAASAVVVAAVEGIELTPDEVRFFQEESPAGVTLFKRNIPESDFRNVKLLNAQLQTLRSPQDPPMIIAIDQEGGRVARIRSEGFPNLGPAMYLEDGCFDPIALEKIEAYGLDVGQSLKSIGINVNFAPVLDILTEPTNLAIGDRCFGVTPEVVAKRAGAYLKGLQEGKTLGCLKHFPGQGDAKIDTHYGAASIPLNLQTLFEREMFPFRELVSKCPMVMVSHSIYPVLSDDESGRSEVIIQDWLKGRLGFKGVVVSDDLNMGALPQEISEWKSALVDTIAAGCDMLLVCRHLDRCYAALDALREESRRSPSFARRLENAAANVRHMRRQYFA